MLNVASEAIGSKRLLGLVYGCIMAGDASLLGDFRREDTPVHVARAAVVREK